jgi:hypothetical protein
MLVSVLFFLAPFLDTPADNVLGGSCVIIKLAPITVREEYSLLIKSTSRGLNTPTIREAVNGIDICILLFPTLTHAHLRLSFYSRKDLQGL